jgi:hypothetical protein
MDNNVPTRIIYEYEDRVEEVSGDAAKELTDTLNNMCVILKSHGIQPFLWKPAPWVVTPKGSPSDTMAMLVHEDTPTPKIHVEEIHFSND